MSLFKRIFHDPLVRRFIVASLFAGAFVWVAVDSFHMDSEVVLEFFLLSIALVVVVVVLAFLVALSVHLLRKANRGSGHNVENDTDP